MTRGAGRQHDPVGRRDRMGGHHDAARRAPSIQLRLQVAGVVARAQGAGRCRRLVRLGPVVPEACKGNALLDREGCATNGIENFDKIDFWRTPEAKCARRSKAACPTTAGSPTTSRSSAAAERRRGARMTAAIEFRGVSRVFGDVRAVDEVSFAIEPGEFFAMLGPSGSGKTTCLRLMAGFERPMAGRCCSTARTSRVPPYERNVNTVFQDYALFPHMTVLENVAYGLRVRGVPRPSASASARGDAGAGAARQRRASDARRSFRAASGSASRWRVR